MYCCVFSSSPEPTDETESSFYPVSRLLRNKQNSVEIKRDPEDEDGEDNDEAMDEAIPMTTWHDLEPDDDDDEV